MPDSNPADASRRDLLKGAAIGAAAIGGVAALAACTSPATDSAQVSTQQQTETAFKQQQAAVPYPAAGLRDSIERRNLKERLLRYNVPTKLSYIYLLSDFGQVITYMPIHGKVSSTDSQMTTSQLIERYGNSDGGNVVVDAPGDDGSYGPNEAGVFFITTSGVMVQWNGKYLLTDAPLKVTGTQPPPLVYDENSKPTSTAPR